MTEPVVRADGLAERHGDLAAVREISFEIQPGETVRFPPAGPPPGIDSR